MPTYTLRPNATVSNNWGITGPATLHEALDDVVTDPTAPDTATDFASTSTTNNVAEVGLADVSFAAGETPTSITAKAYVATSGARRAQLIELIYLVGGTGAVTVLGSVTLGQNTAAAWQTITASTAALTQAEINSLSIRFTATVTASTSTGTATAYAAYGTVNTTAPSEQQSQHRIRRNDTAGLNGTDFSLPAATSSDRQTQHRIRRNDSVALNGTEFGLAATGKQTQHRIRLNDATALNGTGFGTESAATVPGVPTITSVVEGDTTLTAHFTAPTDDGGAPILEYEAVAELIAARVGMVV